MDKYKLTGIVGYVIAWIAFIIFFVGILMGEYTDYALGLCFTNGMLLSIMHRRVFE